MAVAIRAERLGKRYRVGEMERYLAVRDVLARALTVPFRRLAARRPASGEVWALRDATFEVGEGEVLGIIGRNGAGKSTLLKLLSRVTQPTEGRAELRGRVGSLLEVGTGFHPELTGRENIRLSAAILGMSRAELARRFDDIVTFSEIGRYLDTPVKRYSSGMYTRLAFSVAAHLDPEILLIDEVLAVGDADFQRKCLGRMDDLACAGRTVLVVSHNMAVVKGATGRALWLDGGRIRRSGPSRQVVDAYLASAGGPPRGGDFGPDHLEANRVRGWARGQLLLERVRLLDSEACVTARFPEGSEIVLEFTLRCREPVSGLRLSTPVSTLEGQVVFRIDPGWREVTFSPGVARCWVRLETGPLLPGTYRGEVIVESRIPQDRVVDAFEFDILPDPPSEGDPYLLLYDGSNDPAARRADRALVRLPCRWDGLVDGPEATAPLPIAAGREPT